MGRWKMSQFCWGNSMKVASTNFCIYSFYLLMHLSYYTTSFSSPYDTALKTHPPTAATSTSQICIQVNAQEYICREHSTVVLRLNFLHSNRKPRQWSWVWRASMFSLISAFNLMPCWCYQLSTYSPDGSLIYGHPYKIQAQQDSEANTSLGRDSV